MNSVGTRKKNEISFLVWFIIYWGVLYSGVIFKIEGKNIWLNFMQLFSLALIFFNSYDIAFFLVAKKLNLVIGDVQKKIVLLDISFFGMRLQLRRYFLAVHKNDLNAIVLLTTFSDHLRIGAEVNGYYNYLNKLKLIRWQVFACKFLLILLGAILLSIKI